MEDNINGKDMGGNSEWATRGCMLVDGSLGDVQDVFVVLSIISLNGMFVSQIIQETQTSDHFCLGVSWASRIIVKVEQFGVNFMFKGKTLSSFMLDADTGIHHLFDDLYMRLALGIFPDDSGGWFMMGSSA